MSGLSRTPGKRVGVNSPPRVRIPLPPPHANSLRGAQASAVAATARHFALPRNRKEKRTWRFRQVLNSSTEFGRREWTRTIDPHHVKVVL